MKIDWRWALKLISRDEEGEKRGTREERKETRRRGNNLCCLTSPRWPCRRGHGSLHLPEIISHKSTLRCAWAHTFPNHKKGGLMIFQHLHTISQNPSLQFLQEPRRASMCVCVCFTLKIESVCVCLQVSMYYGCVCVCPMSGAPYVPHKFVFTPKKANPYAY